jgi:HD superfamily phosphodiesterase
MSLWTGRTWTETRVMSTRTTIAGIAIPDTALVDEATDLLRGVLPDLLFDHSLRVYAFGALQGERQGLRYDPELLYIAAMFHDIGLVDGHRSAHDRFEVDGANAAREFLRQRGLEAESIRIVWDAIALHTTPGIPQHKEPEVALVTAGVELDVLGIGYDELMPAEREEILAALPRVDFKHRIIDAFGAGIAHKPETAFGNVKADVLERTLPGYVRPNFCDMILGSKFAE